ncbi:MAG: creatininase family protein [Candidatus Latescibacteria bacterium]|jgi:creatinine amidohydrolase/Fe(II)-dependent formamide hydrolase-like protein|nr:creatininase family protein [Candidatus Latescibacterota bacterium]
MNPSLSPDLQMQYMRPGQVETAGRVCPVVYVPCGPIEWHGLHNPLGYDVIKAHSIVVKAAEKFGGVVYSPVYFHSDFDQNHLVQILTHLFEQLKRPAIASSSASPATTSTARST